jgi:signal peptidase
MDMERELREIGEGITIAVCVYLLLQASVMVVLGVEKPLYVVISGSMEPVYYKGDILVVKGTDVNQIEAGDIIVFDSPFGGIPIVHRVYRVEYDGETPYFITKGDNNNTIDTYYQNSYPGIPPDHIIGEPFLKIPRIGIVQIWLRELVRGIRCLYLQPT